MRENEDKTNECIQVSSHGERIIVRNSKKINFLDESFYVLRKKNVVPICNIMLCWICFSWIFLLAIFFSLLSSNLYSLFDGLKWILKPESITFEHVSPMEERKTNGNWLKRAIEWNGACVFLLSLHHQWYLNSHD